ncbi:unnamed protein product, partial [Allacma fusca]
TTNTKKGTAENEFKINWFNTLSVVTFHVFGVIGLGKLLQGSVLGSTLAFGMILAELGCLGLTIGGHRLW